MRVWEILGSEDRDRDKDRETGQGKTKRGYVGVYVRCHQKC